MRQIGTTIWNVHACCSSALAIAQLCTWQFSRVPQATRRKHPFPCTPRAVPLPQVYAGPETKDLAGHLMVYPYHVSENGSVSYLGSEMLPDTKTAKVRLRVRLQAAC